MLNIKRAGITFQLAFLGCQCPRNFQQWRSWRTLPGVTQETPKPLRTKCEMSTVNSQRLIVSSSFSQRQQWLISWNPHLLRLSTVRILPKVVAHKKKAMRGGDFTFQMLFEGNELNYSLPREVNMV